MFSVHPEVQPLSQCITICNQRGLHARAAVKLSKLASQFTAKIEVCRNGMSVSCLSIMGLMMLAATQGGTIEIRAYGPDAEKAITATATLISHGFDED